MCDQVSSRFERKWAPARPVPVSAGLNSAVRRASPWRRSVRALVLAALLGGAFGAQPSFGSTSATTFAHHAIKPPATCTQSAGRWAERTASAGVGADGDAGADLNADSVNDLWVAQPGCDINGLTDQGRVHLLSGKDFRTNTTNVIRNIDSPEPQANAKFGFFISVLGNATNDITIGTDSQDVTAAGVSCTAGTAGCNTDQGKAWVFNGNTGALRYALNNPVPQGDARFGSRIGRAGDINSDGFPDIIVGASNNDVGGRTNQGQAFIFSGNPADHVGGASGLLRTLDMPTTDAVASGNFGLAVQGPGDVNGDGVTDQLVDATNFQGEQFSGQGRMYLFSGANGNLIRTIDDPTPQAGADFGFQDVTPLAPGDLNPSVTPARPDVYGNGFLQDVGTNTGQGRSWVFDGNNNTVLRTLNDPTPEIGGQFGWSMDKTDYNHQLDTVNDLYIGQSPHHVTGGTGYGGTYVLNGTNGALLKALELPTACQQTDARLGWTVSSPGDLNGDGEPDYVAGAPYFDRTPNTDEGVMLVFMSNEPDNPNTGC